MLLVDRVVSNTAVNRAIANGAGLLVSVELALVMLIHAAEEQLGESHLLAKGVVPL